MTDTPAPRPKLAHHWTPGTGPAIVFLPGYASDMQGSKALALEEWAKANGRAFLRFDHGHAPLGQQWYRQLRQLFLARFDL